jgi:hypothetical protein
VVVAASVVVVQGHVENGCQVGVAGCVSRPVVCVCEERYNGREGLQVEAGYEDERVAAATESPIEVGVAAVGDYSGDRTIRKDSLEQVSFVN